MSLIALRSVVFGGIFFVMLLLIHITEDIPSVIVLAGLIVSSLLLSSVIIFLLAEQYGGYKEMKEGAVVQLIGISIAVLGTFVNLAIIYYHAFFAGWRGGTYPYIWLIVPSWLIGAVVYKIGTLRTNRNIDDLT